MEDKKATKLIIYYTFNFGKNNFNNTTKQTSRISFLLLSATFFSLKK